MGGSPPPVADAAITTRAKDWLHRVQSGDIDRTQLNGQMNAVLTDAAIKGAATQFGPLGSPGNFTLVDMRTVAGSNAYLYRATFATTSLFWLFSVDQSGKIDGLRFLPAH